MRILMVVAAWLLANFAIAATTAQIVVQSSPVAGFQFYAGKSIWKKMHEGDVLGLVREPANSYDTQAVRVEWHGIKLGYLPRRDNTAVARLLDNGIALNARISRLTKSHNPWQRVMFDIYEPMP